jgi:two-component system, OmpR family, phosphate regulon sensor histidine kinase PhoR
VNSIRFRLTFLFLLTVFACIVSTGFFSAGYFKEQYIKNLNEELLDRGMAVEFLLEDIPQAMYQRKILDFASKTGKVHRARITVIGLDGVVIADSESAPEKMENHSNRPEVRAANRDGIGFSRRESSTLKHEFLYVARRAKLRAGPELIIRMAAPAEYVDATVGHMKMIIFLSVAAILVLSVAITLVISYGFTAPIMRLNETAEKIASGDLSARSGLKSKDEFGRLGEAVDRMAEEIQKYLEDIHFKKNEIENILDSIQDGLILIDRDRRILLISDSVPAMFGLDKDDYSGKPLINVVRHRNINDDVRAVLEGGRPCESELELNPISRTTLEARTFPYKNEDGVIAGAVVVLRDVSRIKRLETVRKEFVENASHEMRTPVTLIRGFIETLMSGAADEERDRRRFMELLDKESLRLMNLTEDILALAEAEQSSADKGTGTIDVAAELIECAASYERLATEKGLEIEKNFSPGTTLSTIDAEDFRRIFSNLIDNAVKFTEKGKISISFERTGDRLRITISDTGIGIQPSDMARIFERFYRADKSRSRQMGGTGLGLSIVRHLVEKRKGTVSIESSPGKGASFSVEFPL